MVILGNAEIADWVLSKIWYHIYYNLPVDSKNLTLYTHDNFSLEEVINWGGGKLSELPQFSISSSSIRVVVVVG